MKNSDDLKSDTEATETFARIRFSDSSPVSAKAGLKSDNTVDVHQPVSANKGKSNSMSCPIDKRMITFWNEKGYLLVDDIFNEQLVSLVRDATIPLIDEHSRNSLLHRKHVNFPFPFEDGETLVLNKIPFHSRLNEFVMALLGTEYYEVVLSRAEVAVQMQASDEPLHLDCVNQSSLMLPDLAHDIVTGARQSEALTAVVYLDEGDICGGFTHLVPRNDQPSRIDIRDNSETKYSKTEHEKETGPKPPSMNFNLAWYSPGTGVVPWDDDKDRAESYFNSDDTLLQSLRELREKLYQSERRMNFSKGTTLFYRHDVWQRQIAINPKKLLRSYKIVFKRKTCTWLPNLNLNINIRALDKIIAEGNFLQRCLLGFPAPNSGYWTKDTVQAIIQRYQYIPGGFLHHKILSDGIKSRLEIERNKKNRELYIQLHNHDQVIVGEDGLETKLTKLKAKRREEKMKKKEYQLKQRMERQEGQQQQQQHPYLHQQSGSGPQVEILGRGTASNHDATVSPVSLSVPHRPAGSLQQQASPNTAQRLNLPSRPSSFSPMLENDVTYTTSPSNIPSLISSPLPTSTLPLPDVNLSTPRQFSDVVPNRARSSGRPMDIAREALLAQNLQEQARLGEGVSGSSDSSPIVLSSQRNSPLDFTQQREQSASQSSRPRRSGHRRAAVINLDGRDRTTNRHPRNRSSGEGSRWHSDGAVTDESPQGQASLYNREDPQGNNSNVLAIEDDTESINSEDLDNLLDVTIEEDCTGRYLTYVTQFYRQNQH